MLMEEKKSLETESASWKTRVQQLLDKYQRVDPETHKKLLEDHTVLSNTMKEREVELETVKNTLNELQKQLAEETTKVIINYYNHTR